MTSIAAAKLMLAASGLIIWGYGIRTSAPILKWLGIGMLASAVILRFIGPRDRTR